MVFEAKIDCDLMFPDYLVNANRYNLCALYPDVANIIGVLFNRMQDIIIFLL